MTKDQDSGHFPGRLFETELDRTACLLTQVRQEALAQAGSKVISRKRILISKI